jgi:hypothetical protein
MLWIISVTYLHFLYDKNYPLFIQNITRRLASKNILYVKFFQAISLNNNLIDGAMNQELIKYKSLIESSIITYLKETNQYEEMFSTIREIKESDEQPYMTCFGIDVYEKNGKLISEYENV